MRPDMPKIAVERPRYNHDDRYPRGALRTGAGRDPEAQPLREAISWRRYGTKGFSDNLAPLYRFLRANIGRPWDKVWSEMCERISFDNAVQKHILGHVFGIVVEHVELHGREVYSSPDNWRHRWTKPLRGTGRWPTLYVCPRTGLLRQAKHVARRKRKKPADPNIVQVGPDERLHCVRGVWYREHVVQGEKGEWLVTDKRQLGTRELKRLGMKGATP